MSNDDTLARFGKSFQTKTIACLLSDKPFLDQIMDVLDAKYFDTETDRMIVMQVMSYYDSYRLYPSADAMKVYVSKIDSETAQVALQTRLKAIYQYVDAPPKDSDFIKEEFLEFCRNQRLKSAILSSVDLLEQGQYDAIKDIITSAANAGTDRNIGHEYIADVEARLQRVVRDTVETGWSVINQLTEGGLGPGELGVVVAPSGVGKSWCLVHLGGTAVRMGKRVVHFTMELNERYTGIRYDSFFTGLTSKEMRDPVNKDLVRDLVGSLEGSLMIKEYPTRAATVSTLSAMLDRICLLKGKPDLVIVDYADILAPSRKTEARHLELGSIYEDLRGLAGLYQVPIWTASQANRSSLEEEVIQADKIAESYNKVMTSDFIMSVSRMITDKVTDTARYHVIKNRFGPDGLTFLSSMNTATGQIDIFEPSSTGSQMVDAKMKAGHDLEKQLLAKRYNQMKNSDD